MQLKGQQQFDLGSFSQEPSIDHAAAVRYGQQSLPGLSQPPKRQRKTHATSGPGVVPQRPPGAPETSKPQQLPMFMSQREIMAKYQPLDGDRQEVYDEREGEVTGRAYTTIGNANPRIRTSDRDAPFLKRQDPELVAQSSHYRDFGQTESHEQMMARKLDESKMDYEEYADVHSGGTMKHATPGWDTMMGGSSAPVYQSGHTGTYEFEEQNHLDNKLNEHYQKAQGRGSLFDDLAHDMRPGGEGFTGLVHLATGQFGSAGKPEIAGAHHRLAALGEIAPDRLLPVIHHNRMVDARHGLSAKTYPYT